MRRIINTLMTVALLAAGTAALAQGNDARVRVAHLSPNAPAVDVIVNDAVRAFEDVAYTEVEDYLPVAPGLYNVKVVGKGEGIGDPVIEGDLNLFFNRDYTVVALNFFEDIEPILLVDDNTPAPNKKSKIRFVHASPNAPPVDIKVVDGPFLFQNVAFKESGGYVTVPEGVYDLEVRAAGTDIVALELPGVAVDGGTTYTVFAAGVFQGTPALGVVVSVDDISPSKFRGARNDRRERTKSTN